MLEDCYIGLIIKNRWAISISCEIFTNEAQIYTWRHSLRSTALVEKSVHFSNLLLTHFHYATRELLSLTLNWNNRKQNELIFHDLTIIASIQFFQRHATILSTCVRISFSHCQLIKIKEDNLALEQKGRDRYVEYDENSLDFTLSFLILMNSMQSYARLKDFVRSWIYESYIL